MSTSRFVLTAAAVFLALRAAPAAAQDRVPVRGTVLDAEQQPLSGATIEAVGSYRAATSGEHGGFELRLAPGDWTLRVSRIGYAAEVLTVQVGAVGPDSLRVSLAPAPVQLRGLSVTATRTPPLGYAVTTETVRQVPPLGEPDVFRAVVLLPGVSQPNDLKGRIHLAGGSSDETGVHLDGHPLQDPFHLMGLFGAFNVAALERADVRLHHLDAATGGRLSGTVELRTRAPGAEPAGEAVFSLLTSGATVSRPDLPAGLDLLVSGRITYLDRLAVASGGALPQLGFHDAVVRLGRNWPGGWRAEAVGFSTRDHFHDAELRSLAGYRPLTWGESLAGLRLTREGEGWDLTARASSNRASVHVDEREAGRSNFVRSRRDWHSAALELGTTGDRWRLSGGVAVDRRENEQSWVARDLVDEIFSPSTPAEYSGSQAQTTPALFATGAAELGSAWSASVGARVSWLEGRAYAAPRVAVTYRATDDLRVEGALNRRHQFDAQLEEPIEGSIAAPLFLLREPRTADIAAASLEWSPRLGGRSPVDLQLQAFHKRYPDRTHLPARRVGETRDELSADFPRFERVAGSSSGAMASGRLHFGGEGVVQASYTYQRVREEHDGEWSPTSWDAPHTLALFGSAPAGRGWILNAVYHAHSGRATTPVLARIYEPDLRAPGGVHLLPRYVYGARNSVRVPPYHRLDVGVRRSWRRWGAEWTLSAQVLNALMRENPVDYDWRAYFTDLKERPSPPRAGRPGLPVLPSIGLEVKW